MSISEIVGILAGAVSIISAVYALTVFLVKKVKKKKFSSDDILTGSNDQAICLNKPTLLKDNCMERGELLKEIFNAIKNENLIPFIGNHISIVGSEGIGKTLFCQTLFFKHLKASKIYLGWIECNGGQSIYEIVKKKFTDVRLKGKNKKDILSAIKNLDRPCVLFVDQVDQHTPLDEIKELMICLNTTVVVSGLLKRIDYIDEENHFHLARLHDKTAKKIFELKAHEKIENMIFADRRDVNFLISEYIKGNPFLAGAFARAKAQNNNTWRNVLDVMRRKEYYGEESDDDYARNILKQLYGINKLVGDEKKALSKLCIFSFLRNTKEVFVWANISMGCVTRLCQTYWLTQEDSVMYYMDEIHKDVLKKVLVYSENLRELIVSLASYIDSWNISEDKGFKQILFYVEDILRKVKGYAPHLMEDADLFARFAILVANKYHFAVKDNEKSLEWLGYCNPIGKTSPEEIVFSEYNKLQENDESMVISNDIFDLPSYLSETLPKYPECKQLFLESIKKEDVSKLQLIYDKAVLEFFNKMQMLNSPFEPVEVEKAYTLALSVAKQFDDYDEKQKYLREEYCVFLNSMGRYDEVKSLCKEYFDTYGFSFDDYYSCNLYYRYLCTAKRSDDEEVLDGLMSDDILSSLWQNNELSITVAWSFSELYLIYKKHGNNEMAELCKRRMVILINRKRCFWHPEMKDYIDMSDEEFIVYMHSHDELQKSLEEAIDREDSDALYLEGIYQEKIGNYNEAFSLYEGSAAKDNLKGICSLALMYYRGSEYYKGLEESQNFNKAREYWEYCCEREHRGSHYWLGIMLLDEKYEGYDKELALQHLTKAAEMESEHAKQKIQELQYSDASCGYIKIGA